MGRKLRRIVAVGLTAATLVSLTGCPRPRQVSEQPEPPLQPTPTPVPTPPPTPYVPNKRMEVGRMFNGMQLRTTLQTEYGTTATADRSEPGSYEVDIQVRVRVPKPHKDLAELSKLNPQLSTVLPGLPILLDTAKVSPAFDDLYRLKVTNLQSNLRRLDALLSRHNFYDTETVLELEHPVSKRRALLVQSDMDTDTDGSDSDRVPVVEGASSTFQPFTSYNWPKKTQQPNALIIPRDTRLKQISMELASAGVSAARQRELKQMQASLRGEIANLQKNSFLVAALDPFVVLPGSMFGKKGQLTPAIGDYCVVIMGNMLYPAIVGDVGPSYKSGEASLRLCKELNPRADGNSGATSDLKVTYLVFPGSGDKPWDVPDLEKWRTRCESLLGELGGYSGQLFAWADLSKPPPPPVPVVTEGAPTSISPSPATPASGATPVPATPAPAAAPATPAPKSGTPAPVPPATSVPKPGTPVPAAATPAVKPGTSTPVPVTPAPAPAPVTPAPSSTKGATPKARQS